VEDDILAQHRGHQLDVLRFGSDAKWVRLSHAPTLLRGSKSTKCVEKEPRNRGILVGVPSDHFYARISNSLGATGLRWTGKLNIPLYRLSGGRVGGKVGRAPVLLLTTTGRKSGEPRTAPVVYLADGGNVSLINTHAGNAKTPAWSFNLKANPEAEIEIGRERRPVRARIAAGAEHDDLWRKHNQQYAGFDDYKAKLDREPSIFVLEPRPAEPPLSSLP
jgi:F420H(2)-dependent quinone reductase